jgi:hypothetical protein
MQQPGVYDLTMYRGDSYRWRVALWQDTAATIPVDLTGATVAAEIRDKTAGTSVVTLGVVVTPPNVIDLEMTPASYEGCPTKGVWDLQVTYPDASVRTVLKGAVAVNGDVTDSLPMLPRRYE